MKTPQKNAVLPGLLARYARLTLLVVSACFMPAQAEIVPNPTITNSSPSFGGGFLNLHLFNGNPSEFATAGAGTNTFVEMDFGSAQAVDRFLLVTRANAVDVIGSYELIFSTNASFGDSDDIQRTILTVGSNGQGRFATFPLTTARYVRWKVLTSTGTSQNLGGAEMRFFRAPTPEMLPLTPTVIRAAQDFGSGYLPSYASDGLAGAGSGNEYASAGRGVSTAAGAENGTFVDFDLGTAQTIRAFDFLDRLSIADRTASFSLTYSLSSNFSGPTSTQTFTVPNDGQSWGFSQNLTAPVQARYVRYNALTRTSIFGATDNLGMAEMTFYIDPLSLYFDLNGNISGFGTGTGSTINWLSNQWNPSATGSGPSTSWSDHSIAHFPAGGNYTVNLDHNPGGSNQNISGLSVANGNPTLTGRQFFFRPQTQPVFDIAAGAHATIQTGFNGTPSTLTKAGAGTLTITTESSALGVPVAIAAGKLNIGNGGSSGFLTTGPMNISGGAELIFNRSSNLTYQGLLSGSGRLFQAGSGNLKLTANSTGFTGPMTVQNGTLELEGWSPSGLIEVEANRQVIFTHTGSLDASGSITGAGQLVKRGGNKNHNDGSNDILYLSSPISNHTGGTLIEGGEIRLNHPDALLLNPPNKTTGPIEINGDSRLSIPEQDEYERIIPGLTGNIVGGNVPELIFASDKLSIHLPSAFDVATYAGNLQGLGGNDLLFSKTGSGTQIFTGSVQVRNVEIEDGALQIGDGGMNGSLDIIGIGETKLLSQTSQLIFNLSNGGLLNGVVTGPGKIVHQGSGILTLRTLQLPDGIELSNSGPLTIDYPNAQAPGSFFSSIIGTGLVRFNTGNSNTNPFGNLIIESANTYNGLTEIVGARRVILDNGPNRLPTASTVLLGPDINTGGLLELRQNQTLNAVRSKVDAGAGQTPGSMFDVNLINESGKSLTIHTTNNLGGNGALPNQYIYEGRYFGSNSNVSQLIFRNGLTGGNTARHHWTNAGLSLGGITDIGPGVSLNVSDYAGANPPNSKLFDTLILNGELIGPMIQISTHFSGCGTLFGSLSVAQTMQICPGNDGVGTLTITEGLNLEGGLTQFNLELGALAGSDLLRISGGNVKTVNSSGSHSFHLAAVAGFGSGTYTLIDYAGATDDGINTSDFVIASSPLGYKATVSKDGATQKILAIVTERNALETFRQIHGLPDDGSQDLATPAGDDVSHLLKFAFNMVGNGTGQQANLTVPNSAILSPDGNAGMPFIKRNATGELEVTYIRHKSATSGITYTVQFSDDLTHWTDVASPPLGNGASVSTNYERVTTISMIPPSTSSRYARLKITAP